MSIVALDTSKSRDHRATDQLPRSRVTLVVPVYNEERAILPFVEAIEALRPDLPEGVRLDILFVNDGSSDGTEFVIRSLVARREALSLVNLSRNFGKEAALCAGLEYARGEAVVPMDVDLQDDPAALPGMIGLWRAGAEVVNARRRNRAGDSWMKRQTARGFYRVYNRISDHPMPQDVGDFRLLDRKVVDVLLSMKERVRLNKALFAWVGFRTEEVLFDRPGRNAGRTRLNYARLWGLALDGIFGSTTKPLRCWTYIGSAIGLMSLLYAAWVFGATLVYGNPVPGYASTAILILGFGGLNLIALGIIGEYVGRILTEVRGRPLYVVGSSAGLPE
ncbi:glycosyltransferase family 2 protein [Wenxinia saemankumensis]|uniref:Glycosyltransferase involved in cell wall bisynthesis n=1 Tax=Wenxinia saemankumensis TaxID=1447782 RepID=A0A1M6CE51_9RHOB|nr:glycosyltransferase family 2 protein [Wenxinia saemankumensis]SHI59044.1 Glycosyltransferase involved in cell wall bisynthesis [Wenxinia saemankumensis]